MKSKTTKILSAVIVTVITWSVWPRSTPRLQAASRNPAAQAGSAVTPPPASASVQAPATMKSSAAAPKTLAAERAAALDVIHQLKACYKSETCPFPKDDPKSYDIAVGQALVKKISEFHSIYKNNLQSRIDLEDLAREFLRSDDGFVQTEALAILSDLPLNSDNLRALSNAVPESTDPSFIESAMSELRRYIGQPQEALVHEALSKLMQQGSHFSSQAAARGIAPFVNALSYARYREVAAHVSKDTAAGEFLHAALAEYSRKRTGG
jgi:hypothetical protein